ncbi:hypothetical protein NG895_28560 [Aeoliella sp. ICT_H6.2]|uniref:Uncharacterized protein n=1 Tax=Aeoliella straminimaris TaxID=2954799 RepID=A0A9X2JJH2_9BACT|nr:hypothetical protein [Aeoliella straminimaris]MCO6047876.1 hypothetical protein [Aeoliella straminimaris]
MVLLGAISTFSGCASLNPGPACQCPKCVQQWEEDQQAMQDLNQGFRRLVLGTEPQQDRPPGRKVAPQKPHPVAQQTSQAAEKRPVAQVTPTAANQQIEPPPAPPQSLTATNAGRYDGPPAAVAPEACNVGACGPMGPPPLVGPPPRFFPVPARPVFSPQPSVYGYPTGAPQAPTPLSNWGESTDASL